MRIFNKLKGTKGFITCYNHLLRFRYMITEKAQKRLKILVFWEKYGERAAEEAFSVKRRTLYLWKKKLKEKGSLIALNDQSKAPKIKRRRLWDWRILEEIKRLREKYPNLGKEKLYPLLKIFCVNLNIVCPKPRTVGRIIKDLGGLRIYPQKVSHFGKIKKLNCRKVLRKPKDFKVLYPGHLIALDTVEIFVGGLRRYVITFEDIYTRFGFAWATASHASLAAKEFFDLCQKAFPYSFNFLYVLTDNGSEFKKHFSEELKKQHLIHYHTYPRMPKMNSHLERFNRTIQEEFIDYHTSKLLDVADFNRKLMDWLIWYNTERVHYAFDNLLSPMQFMLSLKNYNLNMPKECKIGWPYTNT